MEWHFEWVMMHARSCNLKQKWWLSCVQTSPSPLLNCVSTLTGSSALWICGTMPGNWGYLLCHDDLMLKSITVDDSLLRMAALLTHKHPSLPKHPTVPGLVSLPVWCLCYIMGNWNSRGWESSLLIMLTHLAMYMSYKDKLIHSQKLYRMTE